MMATANDTIGGFNSFIDSQVKLNKECTASVYNFSNEIEIVNENCNLNLIKHLSNSNYIPSGMTALLDAIGFSVEKTGYFLSSISENLRPSKVIFVIITDGEENSSKKFSSDKIKSMIEHQRNKYNWEFIFIGANQDSCLSAKSYGISTGSSLNYSLNSNGITGMFNSLTNVCSEYRLFERKSCTFSPDDLDEQLKKINKNISTLT